MTLLPNGYVLTGGASTRMGSDKALLEIGGITLAERAVQILSSVAAEVAVVGLAIEGVRLVRDAAQNAATRASLYGVQAALSDSRTEWTAILACDLPFVTAEMFQLMLVIADDRDVDAVVPLQPDGRLQPLAALYRTRACRKAVDETLASGELRIASLFETIEHHRLMPSEYPLLRGADIFFTNINTPDDLAAVRRLVEGR